MKGLNHRGVGKLAGSLGITVHAAVRYPSWAEYLANDMEWRRGFCHQIQSTHDARRTAPLKHPQPNVRITARNVPRLPSCAVSQATRKLSPTQIRSGIKSLWLEQIRCSFTSIPSGRSSRSLRDLPQLIASGLPCTC